MYKLSTTSVSLAVTPTVVSTLFSHYLNKKELKEKPTAHLSYDEGLHLVRSFLEHASHHTVEDLQAFTAQWVPSPRWIKIEAITINEEYLQRSAETIQQELGDDGVALIGGRKWWQWRRPDTNLEAEWIEMRSHARERQREGDPGHRVILYIHGGGYYFGSVDEHRYQMQRHARKLRARVFAPRYRLAPQFPFPCGVQDCLAAYFYLLSCHDASSIIIAGDSAGGGMTLAVLCILRNQGLPLPAGAILISPWVDLTHSFPSVALDTQFDYIPKAGFHHKPSNAWPPPNDDDIAELKAEAKAMKEKKSDTKNEDTDLQNAAHWPADAREYLHVTIDGQSVTVKDQIQMYTTNSLLKHRLVSPIWQPTLGGLPPMLIMVGGGELLRDEQIYLAHKCANPEKYPPPPEMMSDKDREQLLKFKPTDVQLQVWDDMCHVGPTLSFTRPAKFMYRSIAQFGAWLLARAQRRGIDIVDDDQISVITSSGSDTQAADPDTQPEAKPQTEGMAGTQEGQVGKAGDPLPPFQNHMIRQRVTRNGVTLPLAPESELPGCCMEPSDLGVVKQGTAQKWLAMRDVYNIRYAHAKARVHRKMVRDFATGFAGFGEGEVPPPTALAGRRTIDSYLADGVRRKKSLGLSLWSLWGSKHDEDAVEREDKADEEPDAKAVTSDEGRGAQPPANAQPSGADDVGSRSRSRRRTVVDEHQTGDVDEETPVAQLLNKRKEQETEHPGPLSPNYVPETGVAGRRPFIKGLAMPFSLDKDADTASMMTLHSNVTPMESNKQLVSQSGKPSSKEGQTA